MKRILLLPNFIKPRTAELLQRVCEILQAYGLTTVALSSDRAFWENAGINTVEYTSMMTLDALKSCDLLVAIGGDGTMIRNAYFSALGGRPLVGINTGNFGFLTQIDPDHLDNDLECIVNGIFQIEERMALSANWGNDKKIEFALNDIVIAKPFDCKLADISIFCDGELVERYRADGLIISTSTGSTAYALSAGGPVIDGTLSSISVIPLYPQTGMHNPLIFSSERILSVSCSSSDMHVIGDGSAQGILAKEDAITVLRSSYNANFLKLGNKWKIEKLQRKIISLTE